MRRSRRSLVYLQAVAVSTLFLAGGCSSTPPVGLPVTPESRAQAATLARDRVQELATLRAEMATVRVVAAKKEAELLELRDLVQQLRLENAESRQALLELRERTEQHQTDIEKGRDERDRLAHSQTTQQLAALKETVVTLAQELGQLRQELMRPVVEERPTPSSIAPSKSDNPSSPDLRSDPPPRRLSSRQKSAPSSANSPVALTVTTDVVTRPPVMITVQQGDTLRSLADRTHTSVARLREINQLETDTLRVGQVLVVPIVSSTK